MKRDMFNESGRGNDVFLDGAGARAGSPKIVEESALQMGCGMQASCCYLGRRLIEFDNDQSVMKLTAGLNLLSGACPEIKDCANAELAGWSSCSPNLYQPGSDQARRIVFLITTV